MTEIFQKLKKALEKKMINMFNRQTINQIKRQNQSTRNNVLISKNSSLKISLTTTNSTQNLTQNLNQNESNQLNQSNFS
jgi:hypothetical protein